MNWYKKSQNIGDKIQFMWTGRPRQGQVTQLLPDGSVEVATSIDEPDMLGRRLRLQRSQIVDPQDSQNPQGSIETGSKIEFDWGGPTQATVQQILPNNILSVQIESDNPMFRKVITIPMDQVRLVV